MTVKKLPRGRAWQCEAALPVDYSHAAPVAKKCGRPAVAMWTHAQRTTRHGLPLCQECLDRLTAEDP